MTEFELHTLEQTARVLKQVIEERNHLTEQMRLIVELCDNRNGSEEQILAAVREVASRDLA